MSRRLPSYLRRQRDFYETPKSATEALAAFLHRRPAVILDPCAGNGAIPNAFLDLGFPFRWELRDIVGGHDYLHSERVEADGVITNPPYSLAQEFVTKALDEYQFVAMLLRLNFLGSRKRRDWWQTRLPTSLIVISKRPSFTGKGTDATEYAWFVWDRLSIFCHARPLEVF